MTEIPASDELMELVFAALDHGIASVAKGGPLIPFVMIEDADGRDLHRFVGQTLEESQARARDYVRSAVGARLAAIAYDGYLTVESERSDAIFVEAQERTHDRALVFAQRYRPGGRFRKLATVDNAAYAGDADPLF